MTGDIITVFNRAPYALVVMKDGRTVDLPPGKSQITRDLLLYARQQHPLPGSEDPNSLIYESFVSYVAGPGEKQRDSLEPVSQDVIDMLPIERINRSLLPLDRQDGTTTKANFFPRGRVGVEAPSEGMLDPGKFEA